MTGPHAGKSASGETGSAEAPSRPDAPVVLDTDTIFGSEQSEVRIRHRGQEYRLRITKQGKLILTK